jgi:hypothetical protein
VRPGGLIRAAVFALCLAVSFACTPAAQSAAAQCPSRAELDAAPGLVRAGDAAALASFRADASCHHWITFYFAAERLFANGERDEAVRWFYIAQLRGRTVAVLDPASQMMIPALQHVVGQPINEYAGADLTKWIRAVDEAIAWDRDHPMQRDGLVRVGQTIGPGAMSMSFEPGQPIPLERIGAVSASAFNAAYAEQRRGIASLRDALAHQDPEEWRRQRQQNGLN